MNQQPFVQITEDGMQFLAKRPEDPNLAAQDYITKPVRFAVHHDMGLELYGENFSVTAQLSADEALQMVSMLAYALREWFRFPTEFIELPK